MAEPAGGADVVGPDDPGAFVLEPLAASEQRHVLLYLRPRLADLPLGAALEGRSEAELRAGALVLLRVLAATIARVGVRDVLTFPRQQAIGVVLAGLGRRRLAWTAAEAVTVVEAATQAGRCKAQRHVGGFVASVVERAGGGPTPEAVAAYQALLVDVVPPVDAARFVNRLRPFAAVRSVGVDPAVVGDGDGWGREVRAQLAEVDDPTGLDDLLHHLATSAARPSQRWLGKAGELVAAAPAAPDLLRAMVTAVPEHELRRVGNDRLERPVVFTGSNPELVRGAAFALAQADPGSAALLVEAAVHCATWPGGSAFAREEKVANGCVTALGMLGDGAAAALGTVRERVKNRNVRKQVDRALEAAAVAAGADVDDLVERSIPDHGLGPEGWRETHVGGEAVRVAVDGDRVRVLFAKAGGGWTATAPARLKETHAAALAEQRAAAKAAGKTLAAEKLRVEALLATERTWPFADWARLYRDHPLTGAWVRRLLWSVASGGGEDWATVRVDDDDLVDLAGEPVRVPAGALVRPWHPLVVPPAEVQAWRAVLDELETRQPFKQAWREVYLLTPAEQGTGAYSNRFAAHLLDYGRAYALLRARDWASPALGYWDGGSAGTATKVFADGRWRALLFHELAEHVDDERSGMATLCATDQVRFEQRSGRRWVAAPLSAVPPLVFSEAMRDVDLFVAVASIAADPTWADRGDDRHAGYWHEAAFGELTESATTRRSALERIVPRTKIADRATIDARFLRVRGRLRTYKIHIGSGNVLMEPDDQYLCIVAAGRKGRRVFLPFEEDGGRLALIISKAFLLADDDRITDPDILAQLTGRRG